MGLESDVKELLHVCVRVCVCVCMCVCVCVRGLRTDKCACRVQVSVALRWCKHGVNQILYNQWKLQME